MSRNFSHTARDQLRWLLTNGRRGALAIWEWFCELGHGNESEARGLRLLREWLSPEQLAQYDAHRYFDGTSTNIFELDQDGRPKVGWCFVPRDMLVAGDVMLAQKIALETDERTALAVARRFAPRWSIIGP